MYEPTASWDEHNGLEGAVAMMWGRPTDWKTAELVEESDQEKAPHVIGLLGALAVRHRLRRVLGPSVLKFNSEFLSDTAQYPWQLSLPGTECKVHRGLYADGFEVLPGEAGVIAPADCAIIVVTTPSGRVFMLHAGRDSLFDREKILRGVPSKAFSSIVFAAWKALEDEASKSKWLILPSIQPGEHFAHHWDDERFGDFNEKLTNHIRMYYPNGFLGEPHLGMFDIPSIIRMQLVRFRELNSNNVTIADGCTYQDVDATGNYVWHSHARAVRTGEKSGSRNLVVVINTKN